jgi:hypothetical protein
MQNVNAFYIYKKKGKHKKIKNAIHSNIIKFLGTMFYHWIFFQWTVNFFFKEQIYGCFFGIYNMVVLEQFYKQFLSNGHSSTILKIIYICLIFKFNYFAHFSHPPTWIWKRKLTYTFSLFMIFILIKIKLNLQLT